MRNGVRSSAVSPQQLERCLPAGQRPLPAMQAYPACLAPAVAPELLPPSRRPPVPSPARQLVRLVPAPLLLAFRLALALWPGLSAPPVLSAPSVLSALSAPQVLAPCLPTPTEPSPLSLQIPPLPLSPLVLLPPLTLQASARLAPQRCHHVRRPWLLPRKAHGRSAGEPPFLLAAPEPAPMAPAPLPRAAPSPQMPPLLPSPRRGSTTADRCRPLKLRLR